MMRRILLEFFILRFDESETYHLLLLIVFLMTFIRLCYYYQFCHRILTICFFILYYINFFYWNIFYIFVIIV